MRHSDAAFAICWITVRVGLRAAGLGTRAGGPTMLLLRVFGFQKRTERLFDRVAERWRFEGPVAMIAGAELALRSVATYSVFRYSIKLSFSAAGNVVPNMCPPLPLASALVSNFVPTRSASGPVEIKPTFFWS